MKENKETKSIALDDEVMRETGRKVMLDSVTKMGNGLGEIGDYIKETKKYNKLSVIVGLILVSIILISLIGAVIIAGKDDIKSVFINQEKTRNIVCAADDFNITIKSFQELSYFKDTFENATCKVLT